MAAAPTVSGAATREGPLDRVDPVAAAVAAVALLLAALGLAGLAQTRRTVGRAQATPDRRVIRISAIVLGCGVGLAAAGLVIASGPLAG